MNNRFLAFFASILVAIFTGCGSVKNLSLQIPPITLVKNYSGYLGSCRNSNENSCTDFNYSVTSTGDPSETIRRPIQSDCIGEKGTFTQTACDRTLAVGYCSYSTEVFSGSVSAVMVFSTLDPTNKNPEANPSPSPSPDQTSESQSANQALCNSFTGRYSTLAPN